MVAPATLSAQVDLVSVGLNNRVGNAASQGPNANLDGSIIVYYSDASNLLVGDSNGFRDVFLYDYNTGLTELISVNSNGHPANRASHGAGGSPAVNGDGSVVVFYSDATNFFAGDDNGTADVFARVRDTFTPEPTGVTELVSVALDGGVGNGPSLFPSVSADGNLVAFQSLASNLVEGDTNGSSDIFVFNRNSRTMERLCNFQGNRSSFTPAISPDGNVVAFASLASNLVPGDTNGLADIFVCDRRTNVLERVSIGDMGQQGNGDSILPAIGAYGCAVAFKSLASNLVPNDLNGAVDVFARDRGIDSTELISRSFEGGSANDASFPPGISWDGRFVPFGSAATDLLVGDVNAVPSAYVRDRETEEIRLVDVNANGVQANRGVPDAPVNISGDGSVITFASGATNLDLTIADTNGTLDVFTAPNDSDPATVGDICCECKTDECVEPSNGLCPTGCIEVCGAFCDIESRECVPIITTPTATLTPSLTPSITGTPTETPTITETPMITETPTITGTPTETPTDGGTDTPTPTPSDTPGTSTPTITVTPVTPLTSTPTLSPTQMVTASFTPTVTGEATATRTPTNGGTNTPTRTAITTPRLKRADDDSCAITPSRDHNHRALWLLLLPALTVVIRRRP